jgi:nitric oxide reductase subunit B
VADTDEIEVLKAESWQPSAWAFWLYNAGLGLWILFNFFPIGWPQLVAVYEHGYAHAKRGLL